MFNLQLISDLKLTNLKKAKSNFVPSKLPTMTNVLIVSFMHTLEEIDIEYHKLLPLWLKIVIKYVPH